MLPLTRPALTGTRGTFLGAGTASGSVPGNDGSTRGWAFGARLIDHGCRFLAERNRRRPLGQQELEAEQDRDGDRDGDDEAFLVHAKPSALGLWGVRL